MHTQSLSSMRVFLALTACTLGGFGTPKTLAAVAEQQPRSHPVLALLSPCENGGAAAFAGLRPGRTSREQVRGFFGQPLRWTAAADVWFDTGLCAQLLLQSAGAEYAAGTLAKLVLRFEFLPAASDIQGALRLGPADRYERSEEGGEIEVYPDAGVRLSAVDGGFVVQLELRDPTPSRDPFLPDEPHGAQTGAVVLSPETALWIRCARPVNAPEYQVAGLAVFACDLRAIGLQGRRLDYHSHATLPDGSRLALLPGAHDSLNDGAGRFARAVEVAIDSDDWAPATVGTSLPLASVRLPVGPDAHLIHHMGIAHGKISAGAFVREDTGTLDRARAIGIESVRLSRSADTIQVDVEVRTTRLAGETIGIMAGWIGPDGAFLGGVSGAPSAVQAPDDRLIRAERQTIPDTEDALHTSLFFRQAEFAAPPPGEVTLQVTASAVSAGVMGQWRFVNLFADLPSAGSALDAEDRLSPVERLVADAALAFARALRAGDTRTAAALADGRLKNILTGEPALPSAGKAAEEDLQLLSVDVRMDEASAAIGLRLPGDPASSQGFRLDLALARRGALWKVLSIRDLDLQPPSKPSAP